jgi:hypothetical protein
VGAYIASLGKEQWTSALFDAATFKTSSTETLAFAAERLKGGADAFLHAVYDWSYTAAFQCVIDLARTAREPSLPRFASVITVSVAEKCFDPFEITAKNAREQLKALNTSTARMLGGARDLSDFLQLVSGVVVDPPYQTWKELYCRKSAADCSEEDIHLLAADPLIGWTAANVFRRGMLSAVRQGQARTIFWLSKGQGNLTPMRWRVVHLLGAYPEIDNILLLRTALREDNYWVRYGALRGLMECAHSCADEQGRRELLEEIYTELKDIEFDDKPTLLREAHRTALIQRATSEWYRTVLPFLEKVADLAVASGAERVAWDEVLGEVRRRANSGKGNGK